MALVMRDTSKLNPHSYYIDKLEGCPNYILAKDEEETISIFKKKIAEQLQHIQSNFSAKQEAWIRKKIEAESSSEIPKTFNGLKNSLLSSSNEPQPLTSDLTRMEQITSDLTRMEQTAKALEADLEEQKKIFQKQLKLLDKTMQKSQALSKIVEQVIENQTTINNLAEKVAGKHAKEQRTDAKTATGAGAAAGGLVAGAAYVLGSLGVGFSAFATGGASIVVGGLLGAGIVYASKEDKRGGKVIKDNLPCYCLPSLTPSKPDKTLDPSVWAGLNTLVSDPAEKKAFLEKIKNIYETGRQQKAFCEQVQSKSFLLMQHLTSQAGTT